MKLLAYVLISAALSSCHAEKRSVRSAPEVMCPRGYSPELSGGKPRKCAPELDDDCSSGNFCNLFYNSQTKSEENVCCGKSEDQASRGSTSGCPSGDPHKDRGTGELTTCTVGTEDGGGCPAGYFCDGDKTGATTGKCCQSVEEIEPPPVGCPWGLEPLKTEAGNVVTCTPGKPDTCPGKAICYYDSVESTNKCCGKSPGRGCPRGSRPQGTGDQIVTCRPGVPTQTCTGDAICQWSYLIDRYQCCENDNGCPIDMDPLITNTGQAQSCSVDQANSCPANYECHFNFWTASYQCCGRNLGECPVNQVPHVKTGSKLATACPNGQSGLCPSGYVCAISTTNQYLCCGSQGSCPANSQPALTSGRATACSVSVQDACPTGSACRPTNGGPAGQYICCMEGGATYGCTGNRPAEQFAGSQPRRCTIGLQNQCSNGYRCEGSTTPGVSICCSVNIQPTNIYCPNGNSPDILGTAPWYCSGIGSQTCRSGYSCQQSRGNAGIYVCCAGVQTLVQCPTGTSMEIVGGSPRYCSVGSTGVCSSGNTCQLSSNFPNTYLCCTSNMQTSPRCPNNIGPDRNGANIWYCSAPGAAGCRQGYSCQQSINKLGTYICCAGSTTTTPTCPGNAQPDMNGNVPFYCSGIASTSCRSGYKCQESESNAGQYLCCPASLAILCPNNQHPDTTGGITPWYCSGVGQPGCRTGYSCQQAINFGSQFVCCPGNTQNLLCPGNAEPDMNGFTPVYCSGVGQSTCRTGYNCQTSTSQANLRVCCPDASPVCPDGQDADKTGGASLWYCSVPGGTGCRSGYECKQSRNMPGTNICCPRTTSSFMCPGNRVPAQQGSGPWYCSSMNAPGCPSSYSCQQSITNPAIYLCCPSNNPTEPACPTNYKPSIINGHSQPCALNSPGSCTYPYECTQASNTPGYYICCRRDGGSTQNVCPDSSQQAYEIGGQIQFCAGPGAACGATGYACEFSPSISRYVCCGAKPGTTVYQCANGKAVWAPNNQPYYCIVGRNQCPSGYSCQPSTDQTRYVCCLSAPTTSDLKCASGRQPYSASNGATKTCSAALPSCPSGYSCELSTIQGTDICCFTGTSTFRCPRGWKGYRIGSETQTCSATNPGICPAGYSCVESTQTDTFVCCTPGNDPYETNLGPTCANNGRPRLNDKGLSTFCSPAAYNPCPVDYRCVKDLQDQDGKTYICCSPTTAALDSEKACPSPLEAEYEADQPKGCSSNADCTADFLCVLSLLDNEQICCGGENKINGRGETMCPNGIPSHGQCQGSSDSSCGSGRVCELDETKSNFVCCEDLPCPIGLNLERSPENPDGSCDSSPNACSSESKCVSSKTDPSRLVCCRPSAEPMMQAQCIGRKTLLENGSPNFCRLPNTCPSGYECTSQSTTNQYICCEDFTSATNDVCPRGEEPYVDPITYEYFVCSDVGYACPTGYICKNRVDEPDSFICCKARAMCQVGWLPYIKPGDNAAMRCDIDDSSSCSPPGNPYRCQLSTITGEYLCCMQSLIQWETDGKTKLLANHTMSIEDFLDQIKDN